MIYMDYAATSFPKPLGVSERITQSLQCGNAGRSRHGAATSAARLIEDLRRRLADLLHTPWSQRIALTPGATFSLNMAICGVVGQGDHVVTTDLEHNSVLRPLAKLQREGTIDYTVVASNDFRVEVDDILAQLRPNTRLCVVNHVSNVVGVVQPIAEIAEALRERGVLTLIDASQSLGHIDIDVSDAPIDMLAFPGHKGLLGPTGIGGLYVRPGLELNHLVTGGTGRNSDSMEDYGEFPKGYEPGTPNVVGVAGLLGALEYRAGTEYAGTHQRTHELFEDLEDRIRTMSNVNLVCDTGEPERLPVTAFTVKNVPADTVGELLWSVGKIAVRTGYHCAPLLAQRYTPGGSVRASLGYATTKDDIDQFCTLLGEISNNVN